MNVAVELINSEWWRGRPADYEDRLAECAARHGWQRVPAAELRRLRALLRRLVEAPAERDRRALDRYLAAAPLRRRLTADGLVLEPVRRDAAWVLAEIAASFAALPADRVSVCANDECGWAFVDTSKNRSRRWCGMPSCGDLARVRRHRARRAAT